MTSRESGWQRPMSRVQQLQLAHLVLSEAMIPVRETCEAVVHKVGMVRMPSQRRLRVATRRYEAAAAAAAAEGTAGWKVKNTRPQGACAYSVSC